VRVPESDCLDGIDNNGDGQIDCDDPTCGDVECVPAVPAGDELGLLDPAGCSDPGFPTAEAQHQGLSQPSCKGCGCGVNHTCRVTGRLYSGAPNCSGSATAIPATFAGSNGDCAVVPVRVYEGVVIDPPVLVKAGCVGSGTATVDDPTFSRNTSFCAARRVSTGSCHGDATKVCAPKPKAPAAKMCVRVPGTGAGCPPGYSSGSSEVYYSGAQKATCGACTCDPASIIDARCGQPYLVGYKDQTCSQSGSARGFILDNNMCQVQYGGWGSPGTWFHDDTTGSVQTVSNPSTGSCTATAPTTPAVPTGASLICCQ